ncbi:MAG: DUF2207 domain-containing protein [Clostridia bacterium]
MKLLNLKNIIIKSVFATCFLLCVILTKTIDASSTKYYIKDYDIDATIMKNGDIHIEEKLQYDFDEDMNGVFRNILYKYNFKEQKSDLEATSSRYQADNVGNIEVYTSESSFSNMEKANLKEASFLSNGMNGLYSVTPKSNNGFSKEIKVYTQVKSGQSKYVKYIFDVKNAAVKYNDMGEIYWNFIGGDWNCDIAHLKVKINFEGKVDGASSRVYPHSYANIVNNQDISKMEFEANNIEEGTAVDARVLFPKEAIMRNF